MTDALENLCTARREADFSGLASGDRVADDLGRLVEATRAALDRLAVPIPPCAQ